MIVIYVNVLFLLYFTRYSVHSKCQVADICITDVKENFCDPGQILIPESSVFGCCPGCGPPSSTISPILQGACKEPYTCLPDGKFAPVQCKGDMFTGRCFCYDEYGERIFGQMWRGEATQMTCACSRRRAELEKQGRNDVSLHCAKNGDYEILQCDDGICWCVEPTTGQPTVTPVHENDIKTLPCYDRNKIGDQYLRKCESVVHATALIYKEQQEHGTNFLGSPDTFCDYDGSYRAYQLQNGIAYCTGFNGEILGSWQTMSSEMAGMNCNCARDSVIYFPEKGMALTEVCLANGNYQEFQNVGDSYYCVDSDGYIVGDIMNAWPADRCSSYSRVRMSDATTSMFNNFTSEKNQA